MVYQVYRHDVEDLFEKVFCLSIDEKTLQERLSTRKGNDFGKDPRDMAEIMGWHKPSEKADVDAGAILIDATKSVEKVVDEILENIK